jgi:hypothetical protein
MRIIAGHCIVHDQQHGVTIMRICPECRGELVQGARFCPKCGMRVLQGDGRSAIVVALFGVVAVVVLLLLMA